MYIRLNRLAPHTFLEKTNIEFIDDII